MIIVNSLDNIPEIPNAVVTSGTFDGVHLGHEKILERVVSVAQESGGHSVVLTFWPHPRFVLYPEENNLKLLSTFDEKAKLLEILGIDYLIKIEFTKEFSQISSEEFIKDVIVNKLKTRKLIIGYDHKFGKNREGSFEYLSQNCEKLGFEVEEIVRQDIDNVAVSSTKIRTALESGSVDQSKNYMGRNYCIEGTVVQGQKIGTSLGFPTANIEINDKNKLIPKDGVYAVKVLLQDRWWRGMMNVGSRPTIEESGRAVEVHIFELSYSIYDEKITIEFVKRLRDEEKFNSLDELKNQLEKDRISAQEILS